MSSMRVAVQEVYDTHPFIREACGRTIFGHAATLESDIAEAMEKYNIRADWSARSLALYTQAVIQGAFILAKAEHGRRLPQTASITCADIWKCFLFDLKQHRNMMPCNSKSYLVTNGLELSCLYVHKHTRLVGMHRYSVINGLELRCLRSSG